MEKQMSKQVNDSEFFRKYSDLIVEAEQGVDEGIWDGVKGMASKWGKQGATAVGNAATNAGQAVANKAGQVAGAVGNAATSAGQAVVNKADQVKQAVANKAGQVAQAAGQQYDQAKQTVSQAGQAMGQQYDQAKKAVGDAGQAVANKAGQVAGAVKGAAQGVANDFNAYSQAGDAQKTLAKLNGDMLKVFQTSPDKKFLQRVQRKTATIKELEAALQNIINAAPK